MAKLVGIDIASDVITLELRYNAEAEDCIVEVVKNRLGKDVNIKDFLGRVDEIDELIGNH